MEIEKIIIYLNLFVWLLPPVRHYGRTFFYYFLLLAISDPLNIFLFKIGFLNITQIYVPISILLIIVIFDVKVLEKNIVALIIIGLIIVFILKLFPLNIIVTTRALTFLHSIIFLVFVKDFLLSSTKYKEVNFFYFFLIFYEATIILKFFIHIFQVNTGVAYYYLTNAFEVLFALYFSIATEEKPIWKFKLVTNETDDNNESPA